MTELPFGVKDLGMIFEILRSKLYSNPILAVCREITCNARDAHREAGRTEVPIVVHLPSGLEPDFVVQDFGTGISPDRVENIFVNYTASTKRDDNIQTGGWGIGSKTPFSVTDSFSVTTIYNGIKYFYSCYIDPTKVGKMALLSKIPTDERNGTTISIPVKPTDFNLFCQWTEQACRHWDVKPTITGGRDIEWKSQNKILEGNKWAITSADYYNRGAKLIIDGIEYPLELDALRKYADVKMMDSCQGSFILYWGVGELSLSANREQIYLDKQTQEKIRQRFVEVQKELKINLEAKIAAFKNLWEANAFYRKELSQAFYDLRFLGTLKWNGVDLSTMNYFNPGCPAYYYGKGRYSRKLGDQPDKISRQRINTIEFKEHCALYINDLPIKEPGPKHVKKAFDDDATLKHVYLICPTDKVTLDELNKTWHVDQMDAKMLSSITKASARSYTAPSSRLIVFKFNTDYNCFNQVSYDNMDEDTNDKIFCFFRKDTYGNTRTALIKDDKEIVSADTLTAILKKHTNVSLYAVDKETDADRVKKEFSDMTTLEDFIKEKVLDDNKDFILVKYASQRAYDIDHGLLCSAGEVEKLIDDKSSLFLKKVNLSKKLDQLRHDDQSLLSLYEGINGDITNKIIDDFVKDNPEYDIKKVNTDYTNKYPLLQHINTYGYGDFSKPVAQYINMMDKI
jgi:hypothetical protein